MGFNQLTFRAYRKAATFKMERLPLIRLSQSIVLQVCIVKSKLEWLSKVILQGFLLFYLLQLLLLPKAK
ncbi:hypothetical protein PKOR_20345 [Pontibacter korlensis]|uniref:Uncharacterized protein n=1 Tax=Pontibacter korlensis TaxID=400092 RepID=A0A0E3ZGH9_9BACT|nr:hypothetical protein PKOR_20345 [Pontibacter korlensis]